MINFKKKTLQRLVCCVTLGTAALSISAVSENLVKNGFANAEKQYQQLINLSPDCTLFPRSTEADGSLITVKYQDWTSGFFPGSLWYIYEHSKDQKWMDAAEKWTNGLKKGQFITDTHDIGFIMYCSYGNAYRLTKDKAEKEAYKKILIQSAESAITRFNPKVGAIKSWNTTKSRDKKVTWKYPVIIDNMMNLDLLFFASRVTGDPKYKDIAVKHAITTMKNHIRPDFGSYHVVNYDEKTGEVLNRQTAQGFADNSTWSRGEAWGIYGFTQVYEETKDPKFLNVAEKMADYFIAHLPADEVPLWDFQLNQKGYMPVWGYDSNKNYVKKDVSAACIAASALIKLSLLSNNKAYFNKAESILKALSTPTYMVGNGTNGGFILKHSVGSIPHGFEIDVPLVYADYYFLEALTRYNAVKNKA